MSPSISADGRYVAFKSAATNFVAGDLNLDYDVFVRDRLSGTTELVSVSTAGSQRSDSSIAAPSSGVTLGCVPVCLGASSSAIRRGTVAIMSVTAATRMATVC